MYHAGSGEAAFEPGTSSECAVPVLSSPVGFRCKPISEIDIYRSTQLLVGLLGDGGVPAAGAFKAKLGRASPGTAASLMACWALLPLRRSRILMALPSPARRPMFQR